MFSSSSEPAERRVHLYHTRRRSVSRTSWSSMSSSLDNVSLLLIHIHMCAVTGACTAQPPHSDDDDDDDGDIERGCTPFPISFCFFLFPSFSLLLERAYKGTVDNSFIVLPASTVLQRSPFPSFLRAVIDLARCALIISAYYKAVHRPRDARRRTCQLRISNPRETRSRGKFDSGVNARACGKQSSIIGWGTSRVEVIHEKKYRDAKLSGSRNPEGCRGFFEPRVHIYLVAVPI